MGLLSSTIVNLTYIVSLRDKSIENNKNVSLVPLGTKFG
ncbi:MAG: hypothetical protein RLZZ323_407 [Bacteroidota bacterium]|jgi:hypothetical protein